MVKKGFSLAEALIVMAIVSVLFSLGAKVITTKPKPPKIEYPHGMFECILTTANITSFKNCHFQPPTGAVSYNIYIFIGNEKTDTIIEPNITEPIDIQIRNFNNILQARINTTDNDNIYLHNMTQRWFKDINLETLLMLEHPESQMFNGGQGLLPGVLITW